MINTAPLAIDAAVLSADTTRRPFLIKKRVVRNKRPSPSPGEEGFFGKYTVASNGNAVVWKKNKNII